MHNNDHLFEEVLKTLLEIKYLKIRIGLECVMKTEGFNDLETELFIDGYIQQTKEIAEEALETGEMPSPFFYHMRCMNRGFMAADIEALDMRAMSVRVRIIQASKKQ